MIGKLDTLWWELRQDNNYRNFNQGGGKKERKKFRRCFTKNAIIFTSACKIWKRRNDCYGFCRNLFLFFFDGLPLRMEFLPNWRHAGGVRLWEQICLKVAAGPIQIGKWASMEYIWRPLITKWYNDGLFSAFISSFFFLVINKTETLHQGFSYIVAIDLDSNHEWHSLHTSIFMNIILL